MNMDSDEITHPTYERLLFIAKRKRFARNAAEFCRAMTKAGYSLSDAMLSNWKVRGVSRLGVLECARILGVDPGWVVTGDGPPIGAVLPNAEPPPFNVEQVRREISERRSPMCEQVCADLERMMTMDHKKAERFIHEIRKTLSEMCLAALDDSPQHLDPERPNVLRGQ